jgi:hypothetical protein
MITDEKPIAAFNISHRGTALIAGYALLLMTILAIFSEFIVRQGLIVPDAAAATIQNIKESEILFRGGICGYLVIIVLDILAAWALYLFLKPVNTSVSLLTAWFRLVYSVIFGISLYHLVSVLNLINPAPYLTVFGTDQLSDQVMNSLISFDDSWSIGYIFFGFHLGLLGYLSLRSDYVPGILGILLLLAGAGYLFDYLGKFLVPDFGVAIGMVTGWGELVFMLWLLVKGGKTTQVRSGRGD